jgi:hypothetical protein
MSTQILAGNDAATITADGALVLKGDMMFTGVGSGMPYGEIYVDNGAATQLLTTAYVKLAAFATNGLSNLVTTDFTNNKLTTILAGVYRIHAKFSGAVSKLNAVYMAVFVDGTEVNNLEAEVSTPEAGQACIVAEGFVLIAAAKDIDMRMKYTAGDAPTVTMAHVNLSIQMVGA